MVFKNPVRLPIEVELNFVVGGLPILKRYYRFETSPLEELDNEVCNRYASY